MNFTREPIIQTIISAKEGYKLSIKSSKGAGVEEYLVDAVEVVSFGDSFFYRSGERPKAFFLPTNDYEVVEVRETRLLIKQPSIDKAIKIGGGKENSSKRRDEDHAKAEGAHDAEGETQAAGEEQPARTEQKRERRRNRRGGRSSSQRGSNGQREGAAPRTHQEGQTEIAKEDSLQNVPAPIPSAFSHLLQPPEGLISDSLKKYKRSEESPSAPGIVEELERSISHREEQASDPELISESPTRDDFHEPLYSGIDESELPPGIE